MAGKVSRPRHNQRRTQDDDRNRGRPDQRTTTHAPREAAQSEQMAGSSRTKRVDRRVRTMAYIAPWSPTPAAADTTQPCRTARQPSLKAIEPSQPTRRLQEGYDAEAPPLAGPTSGPRVSPGTKGRSGSTQDHASKEEVAPAGVTVIRNGRAEQGFHPGRAAHPSKTETSKGKHSATAAGSLSTRRSTSTTTVDYPARQEETEVVLPKKAGTPRPPEQDLRLPSPLGKTEEASKGTHLARVHSGAQAIRMPPRRRRARRGARTAPQDEARGAALLGSQAGGAARASCQARGT
jgi:hypothetical protein